MKSGEIRGWGWTQFLVNYIENIMLCQFETQINVCPASSPLQESFFLRLPYKQIPTWQRGGLHLYRTCQLILQ